MEALDLSVSCDPHTVRIARVDTVSGDSNVSQRKGKVICYFDLDVTFAVEVAETESGDSVCNGTVRVPELMHDEQDFEIRVEGFGDHTAQVQQVFVPALREALGRYQEDLIAQHSKDVQQT